MCVCVFFFFFFVEWDARKFFFLINMMHLIKMIKVRHVWQFATFRGCLTGFQHYHEKKVKSKN